MTTGNKHPKPNPGPTDEPGQQPTPDADALAEEEGVGTGLSMAAIGAKLFAAGVSASREQIDRAFTRDKMDVDIGYEEGLRWLTLQSFAGLTALDNSLNHVKAIKAMDAETVAHNRNSDDAFYAGLSKSDSTFHSGLLKGYGLETDNEVLSTVALAKVVQALAGEVSAIKDAISAATP